MYTSALLLLPAVLAANINIKVGDGGQVYNPDKVTAAVGDTLTFSWSGSFHSVSQSTFASPCAYKDGGINSGVVQQTGGDSFVVTVNNTDPIWIYCDVAHHCQNGMVMVVNQPSGSDTLDAFKSAAASQSSVTVPQAISGGTFKSGGSASSSAASGSSSMMSSSSGSAASMMSTMSGGAATTSMGSVASAVSSAATTSTSRAAAVQHVGDAVAVVGAAALAMFL